MTHLPFSIVSNPSLCRGQGSKNVFLVLFTKDAVLITRKILSMIAFQRTFPHLLQTESAK